jgi:hypothetical protein
VLLLVEDRLVAHRCGGLRAEALQVILQPLTLSYAHF